VSRLEAGCEALAKARCGASPCLKVLMALALGPVAGLRLQVQPDATFLVPVRA
jgi:hypothetical protein